MSFYFFVILSFKVKLPYSQLVMRWKYMQRKFLQQRCVLQNYLTPPPWPGNAGGSLRKQSFSAKSRGRLSVVKVQVSQTQRYKILVLGFLDWHKLLSDPSQNMVEKSFKPLPGSPKYFLTALTLACQKWHQRNVTAMDSYLQLHLQEPSVLTCRMLLWKSIIKWQIVQKQPSNRSTSIYLKPTGRQALNLNSGIQNKWAIIFWKPYFRQ